MFPLFCKRCGSSKHRGRHLCDVAAFARITRNRKYRLSTRPSAKKAVSSLAPNPTVRVTVISVTRGLLGHRLWLIRTPFRIDGKATVIVFDSVLLEGGVGEIICKKLLEPCKEYRLLRLLTGIFRAQSVEVNVLLFDNKPASP